MAEVRRKEQTEKIVILLMTAAILVISFVRCHIGIHSDEVHSIALGDMVARGNVLFKECWFYLQLSSIVMIPFIKIYHFFVRSNFGILIFIRYISVCVSAAISLDMNFGHIFL